MTRTTFIATLALALILTLAACGGSGDDARRDPSATPSTLSSEDTDQLGGVVAGKTPTELLWRIGSTTPMSWRRAKTQDGTAQWEVTTRCVLNLEQPGGLGTAEQPDSAQVARDYVGKLEQAAGKRLTVRSSGTSLVPATIIGTDATTRLRFSRVRVEGAGGLAGEVYGYRGGDFALVILSFCGGGQFERVDAEQIRPFLRTVSAAVRY